MRTKFNFGWVFMLGALLSACGVPTAPTPVLAPPSATRVVPTPRATSAQVFTDAPTLTATRVITATPRATPTVTPTRKEQPELSAELITAAARGDTTRVLELIAEGAPLNAQDERGRTGVMAATHGNHVETVRALLDAGADVNLRDARSDNPFLYAGAEGYLEILKLAYAAGADPKLTNRFGGTALIPACERGHVEVVRYLLNETTVNVNHVNNLGWTCLLEAIILSDGGARHQEIVKMVIEHGADVNLVDKDGVTPLQHAKRNGFREIQALLEAAGAR